MSINKFKAELERLLLSMQFFCLDPKLSIYNEIIACKKLENQNADYFKVWKNSAISRYGSLWQLAPSTVNDATEANNTTIDKLMNTKKPTTETSDKLWYIFFASGKLEDLENVYSIMGARLLDAEKASIMSDRYQTFKGAYSRKTQEVIAKSSTFFTDHESAPYPLAASSAFDEMDKKINKISEDIELEGDVEDLISRINSAVSSDEPQPELSREELDKRAKMEKMKSAFDNIQTKVLKNKKINIT